MDAYSMFKSSYDDADHPDSLDADSQWSSFAAEVETQGSYPDPFACPCCSSVFSQTLKGVQIDLAEHAGKLEKDTLTLSPPVLVRNANIMTMDSTNPHAGAMLVKDGKIIWIGQSDDHPDEMPHDTQIFDFENLTILPGFIEPHMHLLPLAMLESYENIGPFNYPTVELAVDRLKELTVKDASEWIVARQFDPSLQEGPEFLTRDMLDEVSETNPVFVYNASLHLAYCNSRALEIANITAKTEDPPGTEIGRDDDGVPDGVLKGGASIALVSRFNPEIKSRNLAESCLAVFAAANTRGITTVCDQGTGFMQGKSEVALYQELRDSNRMTARFRYSLAHGMPFEWESTGVSWGDGDEWVRAAGYKIVSDGSNQGRTGLQREVFLNTDSKGIAYIEPEALNEAIEAQLRKGWAVVVHANGDAAIDRVLDAFERAASLGLDPAERRCRIEHCSILHDEHIQRIKHLGLSPSFLIGHVHYWGNAFVEELFGLEKAEKLDRTAACESAGIRWTLHSDDPVTEMGPLRCIENAVTRVMWKTGEVLAPEECIPVDVALRSMTIDAAWQCHSEHEIGSLEIGKFADFIVLDSDPLKVKPDSLSKIGIRETWVNGTRVY